MASALVSRARRDSQVSGRNGGDWVRIALAGNAHVLPRDVLFVHVRKALEVVLVDGVQRLGRDGSEIGRHSREVGVEVGCVAVVFLKRPASVRYMRH